MTRHVVFNLLVVLALLIAAPVVRGQQMTNPYGPPVTLEMAKKIAPAALVEARKNGWTMAVAVVDPSGDLVYFERMDNTQLGSINISIEKARSAARFKRPTKVFEDMIASGGNGLRALGLIGAVPVQGGFPLVMDGKIIGAVGVSGGTSEQDTQCSKIVADLVK
jgi:glc operon protein GlcG